MVNLNQKLINKITCANCSDILKDIENKSVDLILTDPPYNILKEKVVEFEKDKTFISLEKEFFRILKPGGTLLTFASWQLWHEILNDWNKLKFWYELIIVRTNSYSAPYKRRPIHAHEYALVFCNDRKKIYFNERELGEYKDPYSRGLHDHNSKAHVAKNEIKSSIHQNNDGFRKPLSVLKMRSKNNFKKEERTDHPTQKDVVLIEKLVKAYCPENGLVLDPFCGVGTTAIACQNSNRNFIAIEIDKQWADIAENFLIKKGL